MEQPPANPTGNMPSPSTGPTPPRPGPHRVALPPRPVSSEERRHVPGNSSGRAARNGANSTLAAHGGSMTQHRVHRRGSSQNQARRPQQRPSPPRPNPPNRAGPVAGLSRPLRPANRGPLAGPMPDIFPWAAPQYLPPIPTWTMRNHERPLNVNSYSLATGMVDQFTAVINDQLELSVVYPFVVWRLGLQPATLPPGLFGEHRMSPMGRFRPSRYAVLAIGGLGSGIAYRCGTLGGWKIIVPATVLEKQILISFSDCYSTCNSHCSRQLSLLARGSL